MRRNAIMFSKKWLVALAVLSALSLSVSLGVAAQSPTPALAGDLDGDGVCDYGGAAAGVRGMYGRHAGGLVQAVADALGLDRLQVVGEMAGGSTLREVIAAHGGDAEAIVTDLLAERRAQLDEWVAEGRLTADAADAIVARMAETLNARLDTNLPEAGTGFGHGMGRGFGRGAATAGDEA
jgi:hypothetical protein